MKAIILKEQGDVSNLVLTDLPMPVIGPEEVLIEVKAISINPADTYIRKNKQLDYIFNGERPRIPGWDVSGVIRAVGAGVQHFQPGDEVFGLLNYPAHDHPGHAKGYAEYVAARASDITLKPANISHEEAAAATLAALTAWQPMQQAGIRKGDRVLITAAGGGVGHYAIQIAKHLGAYVIALASGSKRAFVLGLGADEHIDYQLQNLQDVDRPVDVVLEALRDDHIAQSLEIVRPGGTLISLWSAVQDTIWEQKAKEKQVRAFYNAVRSDGNDMQAIAALMEKGALRSHISRVFRLEEMAQAHLEMESNHTMGKIVISLK